MTPTDQKHGLWPEAQARASRTGDRRVQDLPCASADKGSRAEKAVPMFPVAAQALLVGPSGAVNRGPEPDQGRLV